MLTLVIPNIVHKVVVFSEKHPRGNYDLMSRDDRGGFYETVAS